jgi:signal transduction histidine kinase
VERRSLLVDAAIGLAVTLTLVGVISAGQAATQQPDAVAYLWAVGLGALMLARRRYPRAVLVVSALGLLAYYAAGYPAVGVAVPLAAALFSAAERGGLGTPIAVAAGVLAVSVLFRMLHGQDMVFVLGYELVTHLTLMAAAIALGDGVRGRRVQRAQQRQVNEMLAREYELQAAGRVREERLAIARDLHDSIGHTVSVIALHADVAREALPPGSEPAAQALRRIHDAASATLAELRATVGVLRSSAAGDRHVVSLAGLDDVLDTARAAGFDVTTAVAATGLPPHVDAAAYRIVQEAVTNVVRHAEAGAVTVTARVADRRLRLRIADDGAPPRRSGGGHGIAGMTERARALGGTLTAGHDGRGFVVDAELPLS